MNYTGEKEKYQPGIPDFWFSGNRVYVSNPEITETEEMMLMSECNNNIIANSTFSWWAAYLNKNPNKIVIAPKQWTAQKTANQLDILPKSWIQL